HRSRNPTHYADKGALNTAGVPLIGRRTAPPKQLNAGDVVQLMKDGAAVIDVRRGVDYDKGHIAGSYCVGLLPGEAFSAWVGWLVDRKRKIVLAGGNDRQNQEAQRQLLRIGFDNIAGTLDGGMEAGEASGRELSTFEPAGNEAMA